MCTDTVLGCFLLVYSFTFLLPPTRPNATCSFLRSSFKYSCGKIPSLSDITFRRDGTSLSSAPRYPKEHFFEGSETSPARPSDIINITMKMGKPVCRIDGLLLTGEIGSTGRRTCPTATSFTTNLTWTGPKTNPGLQGYKPATNHLRKD